MSNSLLAKSLCKLKLNQTKAEDYIEKYEIENKIINYDIVHLGEKGPNSCRLCHLSLKTREVLIVLSPE